MALRLLFALQKARLHYILKRQTHWAEAYIRLVTFPSYRLTYPLASTLRFFFSRLKHSYSLIWANVEVLPQTDGEDLLFSENRAREPYKAHLNKHGLNIQSTCGRENPEHKISNSTKIAFSLSLFFLAILVTPAIFFKKNRGNYSLLLSEFVEWAFVLNHWKKGRFKRFWFKSAYEKDSDMLVLLIKQLTSAEVWIIPAPNPLSFYYNQLKSDGCMLSTPYHRDELDQMNLERTLQTMPFAPIEAPQLKALRDLHEPTTDKVVGFVSNAIWKRIKSEHTKFETGEYESETDLIEALRILIEQRPDVRLLVYLHPQEKKDEASFLESKEVYRKAFNSDEIEFADPSKSNLELSHKSNVAISVNSTYNTLRLYMKHKSLLYPSQVVLKTFRDTVLKNISSVNPNELREAVERALDQDNSSFFEENKLNSFVDWGDENFVE